MQFKTVFQDWLKTNKISEKVQSDFNISFDDRIIFPVYGVDGNFLFNKYRRNPLSDVGPKYTYDKGGKISLYGYHLAEGSKSILITEGEKDCLVAWSHNIPAVTSTGGAMSFQKEWLSLFYDIPSDFKEGMFLDESLRKEVIICYDNDVAGADGAVKTLEVLPWAKILIIPDMPNVKDISDYVNMGGNLHELLKTARHYNDITNVQEDRMRRIAIFQSTFFHDAYIKAHTKVNTHTERKSFNSDKVTNAKGYPIPNIMEFKQNKACCPFHNEKTPSLHYYPQTNSCYCFGGCGKAYDAISIYMAINNVGFTVAVNELNK